MSKLTIIEGNSNDKDNVRALMVKGEPGTDGISPSANVSKSGDVATITVTDKDGTTTTTLRDGYNPTITATPSTGKVVIDIDDIEGQASTTISDPVVGLSKEAGIATISVTDKNGTRSTTVADGADLTDGAVPTGAVIGFDGETIPGGFEISNFYEEGDWTPAINTVEGAAPTINYISVEGKYKKIGNLVFIYFYIKGKITALNGTDNYGVITGLPFTTSYIYFGQNVIPIGVHFGLVNDDTNLSLLLDNNKLRIQHNYGTAATNLKVTSDNPPYDFFEIGGSGWYAIG